MDEIKNKNEATRDAFLRDAWLSLKEAMPEGIDDILCSLDDVIDCADNWKGLLDRATECRNALAMLALRWTRLAEYVRATDIEEKNASRIDKKGTPNNESI